MQYDNRYEYQGGNPLLRKAKIHTMDMTVSRDWLSFTVGYRNTSDQVAYVLRPYDGDIYLKTYDNIDRILNIYASISASPRIGNYRPMYEVSFSKQFLDDDVYGEGVSLGRPLFSVRIINRFIICPDLTASLGLSYKSRYANTVSVYKASGSVDVSLRKSFFKNKLICYLWGRDLFGTNKRKYTMYGINSWFRTNQDMDARSISIGIQYSFNLTRNRYKGTGAGNAEKGRM